MLPTEEGMEDGSNGPVFYSVPKGTRFETEEGIYRLVKNRLPGALLRWGVLVFGGTPDF